MKCIDCGKEISKDSIRCITCSNKYRVGEKRNKECCKKISEANMGEKNGMWKGDNVGNYSLHEWIRKHKPKSEFCVCCNRKLPLEIANISGNYKRDINDFEWLCRKCHMIKDGRIYNLNKNRGKK